VILSDLTLSKRLERAEGHACAQFAAVRKRLDPKCDSEWMERDGAYVVFDGPQSPVSQTFGLGTVTPLTQNLLDSIERFFFDRGAPADHEISPMAGVAAIDFLVARGYRPIELSSVLVRPVEDIPVTGAISVRAASTPADLELWSDISARAWAHDKPELGDFVGEAGPMLTGREGGVCFLAEVDGVPASAGALCVHEGVALFAGAATLAEFRRRGLQAALLQERLRFAAANGCDLAMMVAEAGSNSQRNAQRQGFQIAYTRTKWRLTAPASAS
jgi:GNAT superfamily N-acetyltransferase